jgi:mannosyltransferase
MKITLDSIVFGLQRFGGISSYWDRLIRHIDAEADLDRDLLLPRRIKFADIDPTCYPRGSSRFERLPAQMSRYLDVACGKGVDLFHTSYYRVPHGAKVRYVVTVYDFIYEKYGRGMSRSVHSFQKFRAIRLADAVICISHATRQDLLNYLPDVSPAKVHAVHLGVDQELFFREEGETNPTLSRTVLFVGQRGGYKRFDIATYALSLLDKDLQLGIVGPALTGEELARLESVIPGRWVWFGPVPRSELRRLYSSAYALVYPSDYEGFGLPVLEAMACGCPVATARTSSQPEVGGEAAIYAD